MRVSVCFFEGPNGDGAQVTLDHLCFEVDGRPGDESGRYGGLCRRAFENIDQALFVTIVNGVSDIGLEKDSTEVTR